MSSFNPKTKFLVLGEKRLDPIISEYHDSDQYRSYSKYLTEGIPKDVKEILVPALNELLAEKNVEFDADKTTVQVKKDKNYALYEMQTVKLSLCLNRAIDIHTNADGSKGFTHSDKNLEAFTLVQLPYMDHSGVMYNEGKTYVVINSLTLEDALTFDGTKLKFVDSTHSLVFSGAVNPKVTMFKSSITMIDFIVMLAKSYYGAEKGIEYSRDLIDSLRTPALISAIAGTDSDYKTLGSGAFDTAITQLTGILNDNRAAEFGLEDKLDAGYLDTTTTRRSLNDLLSLRNAIGRTISRDIVTSDGRTIAKAGEIISELTVSNFNRNFIDTIHVRRSRNMVGQYVATPIFLGNRIVRGTPIIPEMIAIIPALKDYSIAPDTYELPMDQTLVIDKNTIITNNLCHCLEYLGIQCFEYKEKLGSKKILKAYFEEEYINNRHFPLSSVELEDSEGFDSYVYVDLNGNMYPEQGTLTCHDIAAILSLYNKLLLGEHHHLLSDPDAGLRKRVEQSYDHFHKAFIYATTQMVKRSGPQLKRLANDKLAFNDTDKMNAAFKFFTTNFFRCLQSILRVTDMLNTTNPVATMSSLTKVNTIVQNDDSIADSMRRLTMGHYGRICPYETPQSKKLGVVNNMASGCEIEDGVMYTYYYPLNHSNGKTKLVKVPVRLSVQEEEKYRIADIVSVDVDYNTMEVTAHGRIPARVPEPDSLEKVTFAEIGLEDVQYISISPNQHASIACTTVPYAGSDDAARVSFGMSMVKQAKGLVKGDIPRICTTGFLNIPNMNTYYKVFAEHSGRVDVVNSGMVVVKYDGIDTPASYTFEPMTISTNSTILRVSEVVVGERVTKGQTLVSSNYVKEGCMVIGVNAIVAWMTDGYNYEDGQPGSKRLSKKLTSYGVHTDSFQVARGSIRASVNDMKWENYLGKDDRMFTKVERLGKSTEFSSSVVRAVSCRGFLAGHEYVRDMTNYSKIKAIKVRSVSFDELRESDKICNRHGNKGVSCKIHENSDMPYFENGEFIDIKYNPLGVPSRMNIGQVLESPGALACAVLDIQVLCDAFNSPSVTDLKMLLAYTVDLANKDDMESVFKDYPRIPEELHEHCRQNIKKIRHWKGTFNKEGKAYLIDPSSGKRTLTRVNVGVNYVYKLIQEGEGKLHSRGGFLTSPYVAKTESPTKGASNEGGQRMGYMELDALGAYGAEGMLYEITNERGDNYIARNNATVKVLHSGDPKYLIDPKYAIRRSTEWMFEVLKALGAVVETTSGELDLTHPEKRKYYKKRALLTATFDGDEKEEDIETKMFDAFKSLRGGN